MHGMEAGGALTHVRVHVRHREEGRLEERVLRFGSLKKIVG